ncbi:hypothetical protein ACHAXT_007567 [Thalassiosira profunda]
MSSTTPYQGGRPIDDAPPTPTSSAGASISPRNSARRRRSPQSSPTNSLSIDLCDGSNNGSNPSSPTASAADDDDDGNASFVERRATVRETVCNFVYGKSKALVFGQFLAFILASTGAIQSSLHLDCNLSAPTFSMLSFYFPLMVICLAILVWKEKGHAWTEKAQAYLCRWQTLQSTLSRRESCASLSDQNGLQMQQEEPGEDDIAASEAQNGTQQHPPESAFPRSESAFLRSKERVRAIPEKRNQLLSRWVQHPPSLNVLDGLYVDSHPEDNDVSNAQASPETRPHTFFGIFPLKAPLRTYAIIAFVDVYANYCTILAFKYTTITNVQLFDALAIPSAIIVSKCFFGRRYTKLHIAGVLICSVGIAINFVQNYNEDKHMKQIGDDEETEQEQLIEEAYPYKIRGDFLAILGGILFGIDNTVQEVTVKDSSLTEYLGVMTFFASIISGFQSLILERQAIRDFVDQSGSSTCSEGKGLLLFELFSIGGVVMYSGIGLFLQFSDAAFFNLSILTADAWAVLFSLGEGFKPPGTFYAALVITVSGVFIYETAPSPVVNKAIEGEIELAETDSTGLREEQNETGGVPSSSLPRSELI